MRRSAGLDVLRGAALLLVMARHALPGVFQGAGVVGVVMFFSLSGYLITGLLLDEHERTGTVALRRFYLRRCRRLVPALVALVAGVVIVTLVWDPLGDAHELGRTVLFALTWTGDLPFGHASNATFHLWTLALEEQFYLFWPAALLVGVAKRRLGLTLAAAGALTGLATVATTLWAWSAPDIAYSLPTSWAGCFVIGAAAQVLARSRTLVIARSVTIGCASALVGLSLVPLRGHALVYLLGGPAVSVLTAVLILAWHTWWTAEGTLARGMVLLGTVSYGAYLWNYPVTMWLKATALGEAGGLVAVPITLVCAALSWRYVERSRKPASSPEPAARAESLLS